MATTTTKTQDKWLRIKFDLAWLGWDLINSIDFSSFWCIDIFEIFFFGNFLLGFFFLLCIILSKMPNFAIFWNFADGIFFFRYFCFIFFNQIKLLLDLPQQSCHSFNFLIFFFNFIYYKSPVRMWQQIAIQIQ